MKLLLEYYNFLFGILISSIIKKSFKKFENKPSFSNNCIATVKIKQMRICNLSYYHMKVGDGKAGATNG